MKSGWTVLCEWKGRSSQLRQPFNPTYLSLVQFSGSVIYTNLFLYDSVIYINSNIYIYGLVIYINSNTYIYDSVIYASLFLYDSVIHINSQTFIYDSVIYANLFSYGWVTAKDRCLKEKHLCNASLSHYDC